MNHETLFLKGLIHLYCQKKRHLKGLGFQIVMQLRLAKLAAH